MKLTRVLGSAAVATAMTVGVFAPTAGAVSNPNFPVMGDEVAEATAMVNIATAPNKANTCSGVLVDSEWVMTNAHCFGVEDQHVPGGKLENKQSVLGPKNTTSFGSSLSSTSIPKDDYRSGVSVRIGADVIGSESREVVEAYAHPDGYATHDMILLKLDKPSTITPVEMRTEQLDKYDAIETRTYGWSNVSELHTTVRYMDGETYYWSGYTYTDPLNGSRTESGDSGAPIVDADGKLVGIHKATIKENGKSRGVPISDTHEWINSVIH